MRIQKQSPGKMCNCFVIFKQPVHNSETENIFKKRALKKKKEKGRNPHMEKQLMCFKPPA